MQINNNFSFYIPGMNVKVFYYNENLKPYIDAMVRCSWHSCDTDSNLPNI